MECHAISWFSRTILFYVAATLLKPDLAPSSHDTSYEGLVMGFSLRTLSSWHHKCHNPSLNPRVYTCISTNYPMGQWLSKLLFKVNVISLIKSGKIQKSKDQSDVWDDPRQKKSWALSLTFFLFHSWILQTKECLRFWMFNDPLQKAILFTFHTIQ